MKESEPSLSRRDFAALAALSAGTLGSSAHAATPAAIKIGLYSITYEGVWYRGDALSLEQVIERAQRFGYDGVEIDGKRPHGNPLDMSRARCRELRQAAAGRGLEIYAVAGNNDFSSPVPEHREAQLLYNRELLRVTADLGANTMRVFLAWPGVTMLPEGGSRYDLAQAAWKQEHQSFSAEQTWDWCRQGLVEMSRYAADLGVTLALQNHPPVIQGYQDCLRMVREVGSPQLKVCFDGRLEHSLDAAGIRRAVGEVGALQVLSHFGGEFDRAGAGVAGTEDRQNVAEVQGLLDIGYRGYFGFELCHPLPVVNGKTVGIEFADKNAQLAAESLRAIIAKAREQHAANS